MFFYAKKILFSCSLKCAIDFDKAISNKKKNKRYFYLDRKNFKKSMRNIKNRT
jgi:hypothetical protein